MFLANPYSKLVVPGFPRVRGDVPNFSTPPPSYQLFSPRARGCSLESSPSGSSTTVFPACAGMFLERKTAVIENWRFPRVRGDVPKETCLYKLFC